MTVAPPRFTPMTDNADWQEGDLKRIEEERELERQERAKHEELKLNRNALAKKAKEKQRLIVERVSIWPLGERDWERRRDVCV